MSEQQAEYYFGLGVGPNNFPALEAVKTWVEDIDQTNGVATARPPVEVRTAAEVRTAPPPASKASPQQFDARVRFFPFEVEMETHALKLPPASASPPAPR